MNETRTYTVREFHDPEVRAHRRVRVVSWPVRLWVNEFQVTEEHQPDFGYGTWQQTERRPVGFHSVLVREADQYSEEYAHLTFSVVPPEWLVREREILQRKPGAHG